MVQYIKDNPDAVKQSVVTKFSNDYPSKARSTFTLYYHKARKEAGLKPNGKLGRKESDTYSSIKDIVESMMTDNPKVTVEEMKRTVVTEYPKIKESSVQVYVYRARKELVN